MSDPLLSLRELTVTYGSRRRGGAVRAVNQVSIDIARGETVALVGESGSGKSSIGNSIVGLAPLSAGTIVLDGQEIASATRRVDKPSVSRQVQMVFQDPYGSLNPTRTIEQSLIEPMVVHRSLSRKKMRETVRSMLTDVGLSPEAATRYPTHFSGGQRQRIALARALMIEPDLIICDEAVSALDVSVQAQVLNLLARLQHARGLAYLFISHDLAVVRLLADRIVVLYRGQIMESGPTAGFVSQPCHPYTRVLLAAAPVPDPAYQRERRRLRNVAARSEEPNAVAPGSGCPFAGRCMYAVDQCRRERPQLRPRGDSLVACHRVDDLPEFPMSL
ncbi:ABC transporter ATP-binding protein [Microlunatus sp. Gsoil 973]|uniref:ABC transporter ATP-binding protein n=1 Tax=Microlunatus sp. Gsoil 973 TaxID=2672569 RepID=UPI001E5A8596|nr:oligopeptide/dipeptide ABC transporter ATP-binding protein [Microlunatus sp. Gsoil 973]